MRALTSTLVSAVVLLTLSNSQAATIDEPTSLGQVAAAVEQAQMLSAAHMDAQLRQSIRQQALGFNLDADVNAVDVARQAAFDDINSDLNCSIKRTVNHFYLPSKDEMLAFQSPSVAR